MIGIFGAGVVGSRVAESLSVESQTSIAVYDSSQIVAQRLARRLSETNALIKATSRSELHRAKVVVLAGPLPHTPVAREFLEKGVSVVSTSDDIADCLNLLSLSDLATENKVTLIIGAASSPGMSGMLVRNLSKAFDSVDEVHIALHGTGGPACARQHHRALSGQSIGWHDGEWLRRPAGSGRELCWFPEPVGAYDCYRGELPDPLLIKRAFPELVRATARVSATRRDRVFARMPMLIPPRAEGGLGGLRVEVRGTKNGERVVDVVGVAERVGQVAGVVSGCVARSIGAGEISQPGAFVLGELSLPNEVLLSRVLACGVQAHSFVRS
jgi:saccharopine dehydrogenase-like NADP-dependent oxidoreductase